MSEQNLLWLVMICVTVGAGVGYLHGRHLPVELFTVTVILVNMATVIGLGVFMWSRAV